VYQEVNRCVRSSEGGGIRAEITPRKRAIPIEVLTGEWGNKSCNLHEQGLLEDLEKNDTAPGSTSRRSPAGGSQKKEVVRGNRLWRVKT